MERNEIEREVSSLDINESEEFIGNALKDFFEKKGTDFHALHNNINIINKRKKLTVVKNSNHEHIKEEKYEIVFDNVKYVNVKTLKDYKEQQIEIELKSHLL